MLGVALGRCGSRGPDETRSTARDRSRRGPTPGALRRRRRPTRRPSCPRAPAPLAGRGEPRPPGRPARAGVFRPSPWIHTPRPDLSATMGVGAASFGRFGPLAGGNAPSLAARACSAYLSSRRDVCRVPSPRWALPRVRPHRSRPARAGLRPDRCAASAPRAASPPSATPTGCGSSTASRRSPPPKAGGPTPRSSGASTPSAARRQAAASRTPLTLPSRASSGPSAIASFSAPRTSTTSTNRPGRRASPTCTESSFAAAASRATGPPSPTAHGRDHPALPVRRAHPAPHRLVRRGPLRARPHRPSARRLRPLRHHR